MFPDLSSEARIRLEQSSTGLQALQAKDLRLCGKSLQMAEKRARKSASKGLFIQMPEETENLALDLKLKTVTLELPLMVIIPVVIKGVTICPKTHLSLGQSGWGIRPSSQPASPREKGLTGLSCPRQAQLPDTHTPT